MDNAKRDIVLFLGAGFSWEAGLPTMVGFGDESRQELENLRHLDRNIRPTLVHAGEVFEHFQQFCMGAENIVSVNVDNMEELFCVAEAMHEANVLTVDLDNKSYSVDELLKQIRLWLWKIYHQCPPLNLKPKREIRRDGYEYLVALLGGNNLASRLTVLTTNYDLLLEYFCWEGNVRCAYPFEEGIAVPVSVLGEGKTDSYVSCECGSEQALLCKLHGSINFFHTNNGLGVAGDIASPGQAIGKSTAPSSPRPFIFMVDAFWGLQQQYGSDLTPAIIPPTYAKLQKDEWLRATWASAFDALQNARLIVFIGYSMPETDGFLKAMIRGAMAKRKGHLPPPHIVVVDPCPNVHKRYAELFSGMNVVSLKCGFTEALHTIGGLCNVLATYGSH